MIAINSRFSANTAVGTPLPATPSTRFASSALSTDTAIMTRPASVQFGSSTDIDVLTREYTRLKTAADTEKEANTAAWEATQARRQALIEAEFDRVWGPSMDFLYKDQPEAEKQRAMQQYRQIAEDRIKLQLKLGLATPSQPQATSQLTVSHKAKHALRDFLRAHIANPEFQQFMLTQEPLSAVRELFLPVLFFTNTLLAETAVESLIQVLEKDTDIFRAFLTESVARVNSPYLAQLPAAQLTTLFQTHCGENVLNAPADLIDGLVAMGITDVKTAVRIAHSLLDLNLIGNVDDSRETARQLTEYYWQSLPQADA